MSRKRTRELSDEKPDGSTGSSSGRRRARDLSMVPRPLQSVSCRLCSAFVPRAVLRRGSVIIARCYHAERKDLQTTRPSHAVAMIMGRCNGTSAFQVLPRSHPEDVEGKEGPGPVVRPASRREAFQLPRLLSHRPTPHGPRHHHGPSTRS